MAIKGNKYKVGDVVRVTGPALGRHVGKVFVVTEAVQRGAIGPYVRGSGDFDGGILERHLEPATVSTEPTPDHSGIVGKVERSWQPKYYGHPDEVERGLYFHSRVSETVSTADAREFAENILRIVNQIEQDVMIKAMTPAETEDQRKKRLLNEHIAKLQAEVDKLKRKAEAL